MAFEELKFAGMLWEDGVGEDKNLSAAVFYPCHLNKKKRTRFKGKFECKVI